jgi:translation elongation factor P/translation initiation factor 5A
MLNSKIRPGTVITNEDGDAWIVQEMHISPPGSTLSLMVILRLRNLKDGTERRSVRRWDDSSETLTPAERQLEYLYRADTGYVLIDPATFEEYCVPIWLGGELLAGLEPNEQIVVGFYRGLPVNFQKQ